MGHSDMTSGPHGTPAVQRRDMGSGAERGAGALTGRWRVWLIGDQLSGRMKLVTVSSSNWLVWGEDCGLTHWNNEADRPMDSQRRRKESSLENEHLLGVPQGGAEGEGPATPAVDPDAEGLFEVKRQLSRAKPWDTPHAFGDEGGLELEPAARRWLEEAAQKREELAEEARAQAGESDFRVNRTLRETWAEEQKKSEYIQSLASKPGFRRAEDGLIEKRAHDRWELYERWLPVVPEGQAALHLSWKEWVFQQVHVGTFGGHRLEKQTMAILNRTAW